MEVLRTLEVTSIPEIKILSNVRLISRHDLNQVSSKENLHVQFKISGQLRGGVTCYLCLDKQELLSSDRNYIFPLFVEAMNILVGKQLSLDKDLRNYRVTLSPPKLSMISQILSTAQKSNVQQYALELDGFTFSILTEYSIEAMN